MKEEEMIAVSMKEKKEEEKNDSSVASKNILIKMSKKWKRLYQWTGMDNHKRNETEYI